MDEHLSVSKTEGGALVDGQVVQINPALESPFAGCYLVCARSTVVEVKGFVMVPMKGGARKSFVKVHPSDVQVVGMAVWP